MTGREAGLQPERTALAWQRTALAAAATAALLLRGGLLDGSVLAVTASGCALVVAVLAWHTGKRARMSATPRRRMVVVTSIVCIVGVLTALQLPLVLK